MGGIAIAEKYFLCFRMDFNRSPPTPDNQRKSYVSGILCPTRPVIYSAMCRKEGDVRNLHSCYEELCT